MNSFKLLMMKSENSPLLPSHTSLITSPIGFFVSFEIDFNLVNTLSGNEKVKLIVTLGIVSPPFFYILMTNYLLIYPPPL